MARKHVIEETVPTRDDECYARAAGRCAARIAAGNHAPRKGVQVQQYERHELLIWNA